MARYKLSTVSVDSPMDSPEEISTYQAASVTLDKSSYSVGNTMFINGAGFTAGDSFTVKIFDNYTGVTTDVTSVLGTTDGIIVGDGTFFASLAIESNLESGNTYDTLTATDSSGVSASVQFTVPSTVVTAPTISTDKSKYTVGQTGTLSGANFTPNGSVNVGFYSVNGTQILYGSVPTDANGNFTEPFTISSQMYPTTYITAYDTTSGKTANANFSVSQPIITPTASLDKTAYNEGDTATVSTSGWIGGEKLTVFAETNTGTEITLPSVTLPLLSGSTTFTFVVTATMAESFNVHLVDSNNNSAITGSATVILNQPPPTVQTITTDKTSYNVGDSLGFSVSGLTPGEAYILADYNTVGSVVNIIEISGGALVQADSNGNISESFTVGSNLVGSNYLVLATQLPIGTSTIVAKSGTFTVTQPTPPPPVVPWYDMTFVSIPIWEWLLIGGAITTIVLVLAFV